MNKRQYKKFIKNQRKVWFQGTSKPLLISKTSELIESIRNCTKQADPRDDGIAASEYFIQTLIKK